MEGDVPQTGCLQWSSLNCAVTHTSTSSSPLFQWLCLFQCFGLLSCFPIPLLPSPLPSDKNAKNPHNCIYESGKRRLWICEASAANFECEGLRLQCHVVTQHTESAKEPLFPLDGNSDAAVPWIPLTAVAGIYSTAKRSSSHSFWNNFNTGGKKRQLSYSCSVYTAVSSNDGAFSVGVAFWSLWRVSWRRCNEGENQVTHH